MRLSTAEDDLSPELLARAHRRTERRVSAFGIPSTFLHPVHSPWDVSRLARYAVERGRLTDEAGGEPSFVAVDERDVAAVTAAVLTEDGHEGAVYVLGGAELLTGACEAVFAPRPSRRRGWIA